MPLSTCAMPKAGSAAHARHSGITASGATLGNSVMMPMAAAAIVVAMVNASQTTAAEIATQQREPLVFGVFGDEALRGRAEPEVDDATDQQQPGPGIDVDAEFEAAEPARQHNLRNIGEQRGDDPDDEGGAGERRTSDISLPSANNARTRAIAALSFFQEERQ